MADQLAAGDPVGDYVVDRLLGAGAMGEVYAGRHPVIGKRVAIKVLRREAASAETSERLLREARAANQIDHPNVIDVFAYGRTDDGRLYLVMDLVDGKTLRDAMTGPQALADALALLAPIADALDAAHARGVIHRDLKPDNIMLQGEPPRVLVLDFGLAKLIVSGEGAIAPGTLTGQGTWLGTPSYMAPEQWSTDGASPASDRYALAVIAFELIAGVLPFVAASVPQMMERHFRAPIPTVGARGGPAQPPAVDAVLRRGLAKDPDDRFATARAFVDALRAAAAAHPPAHRPWLPAAAGGTVLAVGALAVWALRGGDPAASHASAADTIRLELRSTPDRARVTAGSAAPVTTPAAIDLPRGAVVELTATRPGYLAAHRTVTASEPARIDLALVEVTQFHGVWRLPDGQLRALERAGDQVDVSKLDAVAGPRHFYRHYEFVAVDAGVAFAADEEVVDPRAPDEPSCHVTVHVEYRYDPASDALELRRDKLALDLIDGHCVVQRRSVETSALVRADAARDDLEVTAPAGDKLVAPPPKSVDTVAKPTSPYTTTKRVRVPPSKNSLSKQSSGPD